MKKDEIIFFSILTLQGLAFNFAHPVTPTLIKILNLPSATFGIAFASMATSSFIFSNLWGYISNCKEKKMIFCIGCIGYALSQLLFLNSKSLLDISFARLVGGIFISAINVSSLSYILVLSKAEHKRRNISLFTSITAITAAFGYLFGGVIGNNHISYAFYLQAFSLVACGTLFLVYGKNVTVEDKLDMKEIRQAFDLFSRAQYRQHASEISSLLMIIFITYFASTIFEQTFNYYIRDVFDILPARTGFIKAITGFVIMIFNGVFGIKLLYSRNIRKSTAIVLLLCSAFSCSAVCIPQTQIFLFANYGFMSFSAIQLTLVQKIYTDITLDKEVGRYNCMKSLGWVFGGLIAGLSYELYSDLPFYIVSGLFLTAAVLVLKTERQRKLKV